MASLAPSFPPTLIGHRRAAWLLVSLMAFPAIVTSGQSFNRVRAETVATTDEVQASEKTIRFWNSRAKRGPVEASEAAAALTRLNQAKVASSAIESIDVAAISEVELSQVAQWIGPAVRLRILANPDTSDAAREKIKLLSERIESIAQNPQPLADAMATIIGSASSSKRATAIRRLSVGGTQAVAAIVNRVVQSPPTQADDTLVRIAMQIDPNADRAFRQLAVYGTPEIRTRAGRWLARLGSRSAEVPETVDHNGSSTKASSIKAIDTSFSTLRDNVQRRDVDRSLATAWVINADRTEVAPVRTTSLFADYRQVVDAASVRYSLLGGLHQGNKAAARDFLAADIAYRMVMDQDWGEKEAFESMVSGHAILQSPESSNQLGIALHEATERDDHPAMLGLIRLIQDQTIGQISPLVTPPELTSALVEAARADMPKVRYEAALLLKNHFDEQTYAGKSFVAKTLGEMRSLGDRPTVVLVETRIEIALLMESFLQAHGFEVERFSSVSQMIRFLDRGGDIRLILSKRQLADRLPIEMVDLVRRMTTMRQVPIVFYNEPAIDDEFGFYSSTETDTDPIMPIVDQRFNGLTTQIDFPRSIAALSPIQQIVKRRQRIPPLSVADRLFFSDAASSP